MEKTNLEDIRFAICITDEESDLEKRKTYRVLPDPVAAKDNYVRVIDESGEDYLYPASYFIFIEVPEVSERALLLAS